MALPSWKSVWECLEALPVDLPYAPPGYLPKGVQSSRHRDTWATLLTIELFTIAVTGPTRCPTTEKKIKCDIHIIKNPFQSKRRAKLFHLQ